MLKVKLYTYGSCARVYADILYPVKQDLLSITRLSGEHVAELPYAVIKYVNYDSRKNVHREVEIIPKEKHKVVVHHYGQTSCNPKSWFSRVYLVEPSGVKELKAEEEVVTEDDGKYVVTKLVRYVIVDDNKLVLSETELTKQKKEITIYVAKKGGKVELSGDTYDVKEYLKKQGFKWDPNRKVWVGEEVPNMPDKRVKFVELTS